MTKAQRRQHKIGNQLRKRVLLDSHNRKHGRGGDFGFAQDGKFSDAAKSFWERLVEKFTPSLEPLPEVAK